MEPWKLRRWKLPSASSAKFYTCARPGRSKGSKGPAPDDLIHEWISGLPPNQNVAILSLLGHKPDGTSEWSFYSFYRKHRSFQEWLDQHYPAKAIKVIQHSTCDCRSIERERLSAIEADIRALLQGGQTVVMMDSGGAQRIQQVCRYIGAVEHSLAD